MSPEQPLLTPAERKELSGTVLVRHQLEEQYRDLEHQHETAILGMWVFLATEVLFFGAAFLGLFVYRLRYPEAFEKASEQLNWVIGGGNTVVLLVSSLMMVLAVHHAQQGNRDLVMRFLGLTALLGLAFLGLKGLEYYLDYRDNLIPGWRFDPEEWTSRHGLAPDQVPQVQLFLVFYWIMTGIHALHMLIGITAVLVLLLLTWRGVFTPAYYTPVDVVALYWHFVDIVWIFILPSLYLLGTHTL